MKLELFFNPKAQSIVTQVALEQAGVAYSLIRTPLADGAHKTPEYRALNPAARVPTLLVDGKPLAENIAIMTFIADLVPDSHLLPPVGSFERAKAYQWLSYFASIGHIAVRTVRRPASFAPDPAAAEAVKAHGPSVVREILAVIENHLADNAAHKRGPFFLGGDHLTIVDAYMVFAFGWTGLDVFPTDRPSVPHLDAYNTFLRAQPAVVRAYERETAGV